MPDQTSDWGALWRDQPAGEPLDVRVRRRRSWELSARTRSELLGSIGAALLFVIVVGWRFAATGWPVPALGLAAAIAWVAISLVWFRGRLRRPAAAELAESSLDHYRRELERRRDHLRNPWIWHGPLVAACLTLAAVPGMRPWTSVAPILIVLVGWTVYDEFRRRRQAAELQSEIDELPRP